MSDDDFKNGESFRQRERRKKDKGNVEPLPMPANDGPFNPMPEWSASEPFQGVLLLRGGHEVFLQPGQLGLNQRWSPYHPHALRRAINSGSASCRACPKLYG